MPTSDECKNTSDELYGYIAKLLADQPFFKNLVGGLKAGSTRSKRVFCLSTTLSAVRRGILRSSMR